MATEPRREGGGGRRKLVPLAMAVAVAGCTLGPDFAPPDAAAPASWFAQHRAPAGATPVLPSVPVAETPDPHWWNLFGDPVLTALETRVAAENLDVRTATLRLAESRAQGRVVGADAYPGVNGNASFTRESVSKNGIFTAFGAPGSSTGSPGTVANGQGFGAGGPSGANIQPFDLWQYGFDASWELDLWGRVRREVESASASIVASDEARRAALLSALAEVARDYLQLRGTQETLRITRESLATANDTLQLTREREAGGLSADLDVANARAQVASVAAQLPQLEQLQGQQINAIGQLLGEPPGVLDGELASPRKVPPPPPSVPVGLPSELARRRPDIRQAEAQLHGATADIGVAVAAFYPTITLSGSLSLQALQFSQLGNWSSNQYALGPSLTLPIFEGGKLKATLELRRQQQQEAAVKYRQTVLQAWHDVDNALIAYGAEQARNQRLAQAVAANRTALTLAEQRYRDGLSDFLDVLNAERSLLAAQQQQADSTATVSTNLVALYKALGGGWETDAPEGRPPPSAL